MCVSKQEGLGIVQTRESLYRRWQNAKVGERESTDTVKEVGTSGARALYRRSHRRRSHITFSCKIIRHPS
jgi:hypothetical protein